VLKTTPATLKEEVRLGLVQSEFYGLPNRRHVIEGDHAKMIAAQPDFIVFDGAMNKYDLNHPIPIKMGKLVRVFFANAGRLRLPLLRTADPRSYCQRYVRDDDRRPEGRMAKRRSAGSDPARRHYLRGRPQQRRRGLRVHP